MTETTAAPNNRAVSFGAKPQREPTLIPKRKRAKSAMKRGLISDKAAKRHLKGV